jgi:hypothetical protein
MATSWPNSPLPEVGREDPVTVEAGVQRAVGEVADEGHVEDRGARGPADDDDAAIRLHRQVLGQVVAAADVGLDDAAAAERLVEAAVGVVALPA